MKLEISFWLQNFQRKKFQSNSTILNSVILPEQLNPTEPTPKKSSQRKVRSNLLLIQSYYSKIIKKNVFVEYVYI